jgi:hypothetical protein
MGFPYQPGYDAALAALGLEVSDPSSNADRLMADEYQVGVY